MPWTRDNNHEFLRLLKELNGNQLKPGKEATPTSAQPEEQSGEGLREQISANKENVIDDYSTAFAQGKVPE